MHPFHLDLNPNRTHVHTRTRTLLLSRPLTVTVTVTVTLTVTLTLTLTLTLLRRGVCEVTADERASEVLQCVQLTTLVLRGLTSRSPK